MLVMEFLGIFQVYFEDKARFPIYPPHDLLFGWHLSHPPEVANREGLAHGPAVKIVCIQVKDVRCLLLRVLVVAIRVVRLTVTLHLC